MPPLSIEERVAALEAEVIQIRHKVESPTVPVTPWWEKVAGTFAQDSVYNEAMKLGHQYRRSLGRQGLRKRKANHVHS